MNKQHQHSEQNRFGKEKGTISSKNVTFSQQFCVLCGDTSRSPRKRSNCDTYQQIKKINQKLLTESTGSILCYMKNMKSTTSNVQYVTQGCV